MRQDQLITLLLTNLESAAGEIEAIYKRCCIFYGREEAMEKCQEIISFAKMNNLEFLESFRLHVEVSLLITLCR